jgi:hypothetical protein
MEPWFATKTASRFPVIGAEDDDGNLLGFATYGSFRAWPAYKYTVENSVYLRAEARGRDARGFVKTMSRQPRRPATNRPRSRAVLPHEERGALDRGRPPCPT